MYILVLSLKGGKIKKLSNKKLKNMNNDEDKVYIEKYNTMKI